MIGRSTLLAAAAVAVALALQISSGFSDPWAVALASLATVAAVFGAGVRGREGNEVVAQALLGAGSAVGVGFHLFANPTFSADVRTFQGGFRWFAVSALVALSAYLCIHLRASLIRARFLLLLLCFAMMGLVAIRAVQGANDGPLRYGLLAATIAGAWLLARAAPGNIGELAAALMLLQPRTLFVLEQGGAEPLAFFFFALAVYLGVRRVARTLVASSFLAAAVVAAGAMRRGPPLGGDPLSYASLSAAPQALAIGGAVIGAVVLLFCLRRKPDLPVACAAVAAAWAVALLGNTRSFAGAWWLCSGLLAAASALAVPRLPARRVHRSRAETLATAAGAG